MGGIRREREGTGKGNKKVRVGGRKWRWEEGKWGKRRREI